MAENKEVPRNEPLSLQDFEIDFRESDSVPEGHKTGQSDHVFDKVWKVLLVTALAGLAFSIYQHSLNGRYAFNVQGEAIVHVLDTRTGKTFAYFSVGDESGEIWINDAPKGEKGYKRIKPVQK